MKRIPNLLTASRIIASILLLLAVPQSPIFFIIYIYCGITDCLDGFLARKLNAASPFGARLDSLADLIMILILFYILIPLMELPYWVLFGTVLIAAIRIVSLVVSFIRFHTFGFLHTYMNKLTGLMLFSFPVLFLLFKTNATASLLLIIAAFSSLEELIIMANSNTFTPDIPSIFLLNK